MALGSRSARIPVWQVTGIRTWSAPEPSPEPTRLLLSHTVPGTGNVCGGGHVLRAETPGLKS